LILRDPYGNTFDSSEDLGPIMVRTGDERVEARVVADARPGELPATGLRLEVPEQSLDESGELDMTFTTDAKGAVPVVESAAGGLRIDAAGLSVGGAVAPLPRGRGVPEVFAPGRRYHLVARWRRFPVTRELCLVTQDGREVLLTSANNLPWNKAALVGHSLTLRGRAAVESVLVRDDAPAAPPAHRGPLPLPFDPAALDGAD
jgi:hypothetical protein